MEMDFHLVFYFLILLLLCQKLQAPESQEAASKTICGEEVCGNVKIPLPFGIKSKCYNDPSFQVICKKLPNGEKPFIRLLDAELIDQYGIGAVIIKNPVTYFNCINKTGARATLNLTRTPFFFQSSINAFGSVGCGNLASVVGNQNVSFGGCLQPKCGEGIPSEFGCYVETIDEDLKSYTPNMTVIHPVDKDNRETCTSAFVFSYVNSDNDYPWPLPTSINIETTHVPAVLSWKSSGCDPNDSLCRGKRIVPLKSSDKQRCGDVDIQFPFGLNHGDYINDWFKVTCNETVNAPPKAFINNFDMELLGVSLLEGTALVNHSVSYLNCRKNINGGFSVNLSGSPFYFPFNKNIFWSSGCDNLANFYGNQTNNFIGGCLQPSCRNDQNKTSYDNRRGCRMTVPPFLTSFFANMSTNVGSGNGSEESCGFAYMVDNNAYWELIVSDNRNRTRVPITLQWGTPLVGMCELKDGENGSCSHGDAYCWAWLSSSHLCVCGWNKGYGVTQDVCQEKKCENPKYKYCQILCLHTPGNYCSSQCPSGYEYINKNGSCVSIRVRSSGLTEKTRNLVIIIGVSTSIGTICFLLAIFHMHKVLKRTQIAKLKQKYYERNGGPLLQQHLSSNEGNVEKIKLFTSEEMEKATDYYNENRVLGQGGQGTVYKGMLMDGYIVAIKKSKLMEGKKFHEKKIEQFVNEIIIVSQVNHRNVVKLLGCCLEAEIPLLVYEFIPNGTLYDLIHNPNEEFPLTWEMRLRIATEIANAVSYLHSAAYVPIYHRDIKSSNILLDDKYRAKVSDFGTSRSIALEQTHLTTQVQGTFGYMDPEYFRSSQFTEKSDVYSFGVVLIELLTGQKPVSSLQSEEVRSLISFFLTSMQENSLFDILDPMVANGGPEKEIIAVAKLAKRCLNLNGKKRPTMKQVALELEMIKASEEDIAIEESDDGESDLDDVAESCDLDPSYSTSISIRMECENLPLNASF